MVPELADHFMPFLKNGEGASIQAEDGSIMAVSLPEMRRQTFLANKFLCQPAGLIWVGFVKGHYFCGQTFKRVAKLAVF